MDHDSNSSPGHQPGELVKGAHLSYIYYYYAVWIILVQYLKDTDYTRKIPVSVMDGWTKR